MSNDIASLNKKDDYCYFKTNQGISILKILF